MVLLRGQRIIVPAYCYPRYDYLSERADTLRKYLNRIEGSTWYHRHLFWARVKPDFIIRTEKPLKSKLNICVVSNEEDSDFFESKQFLVKVVDEEYKTEPVAISSEQFLKPPEPTDIDLPRIYIIVLSGELSEVSKEVVDYFTMLKIVLQQQTYFVSKDNKMCCKMEDISNLDQWTSNLSHLVQSGLEKTVMDVVKQMEQFVTEFVLDERVLEPCATYFLGHLEGLCLSRGLQKIYMNAWEIIRVRQFEAALIHNFCHVGPSATIHGLGKLKELIYLLMKTTTVGSKDKGKVALDNYTDLRCGELNRMIKELESMPILQMEILKRMRRLQFLIHALLRQSPLTCNDIKEPTKLPKELQQNLLKKPFVTGCGTIFGELVIHVRSAMSEEQKKDIEDCLEPYGDLFPYKVEVFVPVCRKTAGQGNCIRAEKLTSSHDEEYEYSSLGCFVDVKIKERDQKEVHFITCHHCLNDCSEKVSVWGPNMEYEDLGVKKHSHKAADIALVQVIKPHLISKGLKHHDGERDVDKWQFYQDGDYLGRQVYKVGATSGTTKGCIVSDNYLLNPEILADEFPQNLFLITPYSALNVASKFRIVERVKQGAGAADVQHPFFSYDGDSGSVVCDINPDSGDGLVLGILQGVVFDENHPEHYTYSYASNMKSALNMLKDKHPDIESIEPSLDQDQYPDLPGTAAF